jgi:N-acetyl sugar amidotransferase
MQYCTKCVYPAVAATPLTFDADGVCSGCRASLHKDKIDWVEREEYFKELIEDYRGESEYDCILPVSGGKDSYFAAHLAKKYGLNALMVTYHGNNYMDEGEYNLHRMKDIFGFDHIIYHPSTDTLIKLNRLGLRITGDMNWQNHCGIFTVPIQIAVRYKVPLIFWGDHGFSELGGMYSHDDFIEFTAKDRYEHGLHGFDWFDFVEDTEGLTEKDLRWAQYPKDEDLLEVGVRGIYLSNYFYYDGNKHADIAMSEYGWKTSDKPFERTYRKISNLDDMHENGIHDYLKYIKLGYGRGTDHACYDIRLGRMTREEGIEMVKKYDHIKSSDLQRWLKYVGMTEKEFDEIADTFRNPRVWSKVNGEWIKQNIWDA